MLFYRHKKGKKSEPLPSCFYHVGPYTPREWTPIDLIGFWLLLLCNKLSPNLQASSNHLIMLMAVHLRKLDKAQSSGWLDLNRDTQWLWCSVSGAGISGAGLFARAE